MEYFTLVFALVIGIVCLWISLKFIKIYRITQDWNAVQAKVLFKELVLNEQGSNPKTPYRLKIEYAYQYNNMDYRGTKVDLTELYGGYSAWRKKEGDKKIARIKDDVSVYVNPKDPSQAVMYRDGIILYSFVFIMGIFSILLGFSYVL